MSDKGTLIFFCGKMGSGKTTLSKKLAQDYKAILIAEDEWLQRLYPEEISTLEDYLKYSSRLKLIINDHVKHLLNSGISVVMDFPANTKKGRTWFKKIFSEGNNPHKLFYLEVDDATCLKQIQKRTLTQPERERFDTEEIFYQLRTYFEPPSEDEGFDVKIYS